MIETIPNCISKPNSIVEFCREHTDLFDPREGESAHGTIFPFNSKFSTMLVHKHFTVQHPIYDLIFDDSKFDPDLKDLFDFIQIQRYMPGDFIVPHTDAYDITKLHLVTLTSSDVDGLVCQDGDDLVKVNDVAGTKIDFDYSAWHWVDPVVKERYSIVIGE